MVLTLTAGEVGLNPRLSGSLAGPASKIVRMR